MRIPFRRLASWLNLLVILAMSNHLLWPIYSASAAPVPVTEQRVERPVEPQLPFLNDPESILATNPIAESIPVGVEATPVETALLNGPAAQATSPASSGLMFIENVGQFDPQAHFQVRGGGPGVLT